MLNAMKCEVAYVDITNDSPKIRQVEKLQNEGKQQ